MGQETFEKLKADLIAHIRDVDYAACAEQIEDLDADFEELEKIGSYEGNHRRWGQDVYWVYAWGDQHVAVGYYQGATENQEDDFEGDIRLVVPVEKTVTVWETVG